MQRKRFIQVVAIILAILLLAGLLTVVLTSVTAKAAASQSDLDNLKNQQSALEQKTKEIQSQLNSLKYQQSTALAKKEVLDNQVSYTQDQIDNITNQIAQYDVLILKKQDDVAAAKKAEDAQWALYKTRIRAMEENGSISYISVIFKANSFADLLSRIEFIGEIMDYDNNLYKRLNDDRLNTEKAEADLVQTQKDQQTTKTSLVAKKTELNTQQDQANQLLKSIESNVDQYTALYNAAEADENAIQTKINNMADELKKKAATNAGASVKGNGNFIWPTPSCHVVTSPFGMRMHPILGVYKMHTGIDIGADYGASILAADGGTVIISGYDDGGYGNYIVIDHGNGFTTLYGHMSKREVSEGQSVYQGQEIGLVGSTGNSTGPHLHFEISQDGTRVNPLNYFTGYTIDD